VVTGQGEAPAKPHVGCHALRLVVHQGPLRQAPRRRGELGRVVGAVDLGPARAPAFQASVSAGVDLEGQQHHALPEVDHAPVSRVPGETQVVQGVRAGDERVLATFSMESHLAVQDSVIGPPSVILISLVQRRHLGLRSVAAVQQRPGELGHADTHAYSRRATGAHGVLLPAGRGTRLARLDCCRLEDSVGHALHA